MLINFFKKDKNIYAPVNGFCVDIKKCKDPTFSEKKLGDGFIIIPSDNIVHSPCNGMITMIYPALHAFGVKTNNDLEILVHIGLNTYELKDKCFEKLVSVGDRVSKGTPIIKMDLKRMIKEGYDTSIIVVFVGNNNVSKINLNQDVTINDIIVEALWK